VRDHVPALGGIAIKARVLCVFWAIGAKTIRALAGGTLDHEAARGHARQQ
jgi:hypothetical protein